MSILKKHYGAIPLLLLILLANWFSDSPERIERWYVHFFYDPFSNLLRNLVGWIPFSLGDILYIILVCFVFYKIAGWCKSSFKSPNIRLGVASRILKIFTLVGWIWVIFNFMWGFNYYRTSISTQFGFEMQVNPSKSDITALTHHFLAETQKYSIGRKKNPWNESKKPELAAAYQHLSKHHASISYQNMSFKRSLFVVVGNYMGYSGYYNPFTGEAQINDRMPVFTIPFTSLHEIAHQLGYAKESEANFIGYLAASSSLDSSIQYAANLEMFLYANGSLARRDSTLARNMMMKLPDVAKQDLKEYNAFVKKYQGPIDDATTWFYGRFLKINNQPEGMHSYSRVTIWLLGYLKKNGMLK